MFFRSHTPARPLSDFVEWFWYCAGANVKRHERILPTGTFELVVNLAEDAVRIEEPRHARYSGAIVSGTYSRPFVIDAVQHVSMFGVHFKPGGAGALLGIPASELTDAHVDLSR